LGYVIIAIISDSPMILVAFTCNYVLYSSYWYS